MKITKLFFQTIIGLTLMVASNVQAATLTFDDEFLKYQPIDYLHNAVYKGVRFYQGYSSKLLGTYIRSNNGPHSNSIWRKGVGGYKDKFAVTQGDSWSVAPAYRWLTLRRPIGDRRPFSFKGAHFANWIPNASHGQHWNSVNSTWLELRAYKINGQLLATKRVTLGDWQWVDFAYDDLHRIEFRTDNWTLAMDNLAVVEAGETAEVPIPAAALLFAPALLGFMGLRRKIKASA